MTDAKDVHPAIRRATPDDAAPLTELAARTFWDTFAEHNRREDMEAYMSVAFTAPQLAAEIADPRATFFVAEAGGTLAGYAKLYAGDAPPCVTGPRPVELARLYVSRDCLGAGVGQELMQACLDEARRAGHATMFLGVWERNERAKAFYLKHGFKFVGEHIFVLGEDRQTDLLMERAL
jgi:diamine N-acetyltransferase